MPQRTPFLLQLLIIITATTAATDDDLSATTTKNSIVFSTLGRSRYAFDIFTLPIAHSSNNHHQDELQLTNCHQSINYNGHFPSLASSSSLLTNQTQALQYLVYVTERHGVYNLYLDSYLFDTVSKGNPMRREALEVHSRVQIPLLGVTEERHSGIGAKDRPSISGEFLIYVSTHEDLGVPRKSWAAVYSTHLITGETRRLTPNGVADFSPAVSPSGVWTAVASSGEKGWDGEVEELDTDIYVFRTRDGAERIRIVKHGGWPCWFNEFTLYFHRKSGDGWWSVYRAVLPRRRGIGGDSIVIERVTPPGLHAFTPATSVWNKTYIAVATRRPTSNFRHIELFDVVQNELVELTRTVSPNAHHYNPFISPDGIRVGYHRCRGGVNVGESTSLLFLESVQSPSSDVSLFRIDGSFPSFSPNGDRIAYVGFPGVYVVNRDGSSKRQLLSGTAFSTAWDWKRKGVVYTSIGPTFARESTQVDIVSIDIDETTESVQQGTLSSYSYKKLTFGGQNNAFPSPSPDGKWIAFRSGRSGHKNLYVMDALEGERGDGFRRLTEGPWTDTMCNWSPNGEWIAFASDRDNPGGGSFAIYFIHPNGTGLKKVVHSGANGRTNHPWFSPDSKSFTFTSDYAAVSAEPVANPHHFQPYGDIFMANSDGSGIQRLTHNSYEDGTPTWGPSYMSLVDVEAWPPTENQCSFDDCHWLGQAPKSRGNTSLKIRCT